MTGLIRWKSLWQILPTGSSTEDPKDAVDDFSIRSSWSSFAVGSNNWFG